ncbi:hypothetical protein [Okeania sp. KiyG1]|uniref:hypothetical protein n=1 Tax=Okeania sp. KiyG1 TaxID=2720165 RepID=UPI0019209100|nr:hypothetical protein [Okeania sp. KiyG1]
MKTAVIKICSKKISSSSEKIRIKKRFLRNASLRDATQTQTAVQQLAVSFALPFYPHSALQERNIKISIKSVACLSIYTV